MYFVESMLCLNTFIAAAGLGLAVFFSPVWLIWAAAAILNVMQASFIHY